MVSDVARRGSPPSSHRRTVPPAVAAALAGLLFLVPVARAQGMHGNEWTLFSFTTPTALADSACVEMPGSSVVDLWECVVVYRHVADLHGTAPDSVWTEFTRLAVTDSHGGELLRFRFRPPSSGWWEVGVYALTVGNPTDYCMTKTVIGYWNLGIRAGSIPDLREGM